MGVIAEFTTPASTFAVGRAIGDDSGLTIELERVVPTDETMIPFFWAWGEDIESFDTRLRAEPGVNTDSPLARTERGALYQIEWTGEMSEVMRGLLDLEFTLLSGKADAERWRFEIRFDDGDTASAFHTYLVEHDVPHELTRIQGLTDLSSTAGMGLTEKQRDALIAAYDGGYFSVPREMTMNDLADRLDIASSSASDRLRRGVERLVEGTMIAEREIRRAPGRQEDGTEG